MVSVSIWMLKLESASSIDSEFSLVLSSSNICYNVVNVKNPVSNSPKSLKQQNCRIHIRNFHIPFINNKKGHMQINFIILMFI